MLRSSIRRRTGIRFVIALVAAPLALLAVASSGVASDDPPEAETPATETATAGQASDATGDLESLVARLRQNAEEFGYTVGEAGGRLTIATISEPLTFNLAVSNDAGSSNVLGYLFEGLTETSWLTDEVEPSLAESWERSTDGLTWTFHLRRDVTWHDGEPFTAHDVDFTFNRIIYNDEIQASARPTFEFRHFTDGSWQTDRMTVTALDDHTVQIVLPVPFAPFLRSLGTAIYPEHLLERHVDGGDFASAWGITTDPSEIVGTGAFTIASYEPGERLELRRNPNYWMTDADGNRLPYLDEVTHVIVEDLEDELAAFLDGSSDVHGVLGAEYADLEPLQEQDNFTIHRRGPAFGTTFLAFNMNPGGDADTGESYLDPVKLEWFSNTAFRQAVAHSIDKDTIITEVQDGQGYPQWSPISPAAGAFHNPDVRRYDYDPARAKEILDELGWTDRDGDGVREDSAGNRIEFTLVTNAGNSVRERTTELIQQGMEAIGLAVDYRAIEFGELVDQLTETYDWQTMVIGFTGGPEPHNSINLWHSSGNLHLWHPNQPSPATDWEAKIDDLFVTAGQELDNAERVVLYHRFQQIVAENVPLVYTTLSERLTAVRNTFGNTAPTLFGLWDIRYLYRTDLEPAGPPTEVPTG
ncbi:MAG: ABC transporter substrate-binding protein [bacterium]|nr:ABC transporter substrate-binding protein [bacterium]